MLRSPGGFGAGNGSGRGTGGSSFARIALKLRTRGDSGNRSRSIVPRSSSISAALSSVRSSFHRSSTYSEERRLAKADTLRSFIDEAYAAWAEENIRTASTIRSSAT